MSDPISMEHLQALAERVNQLIPLVSQGDRHNRKELLVAARALYLAVETPMEAVLRTEWAEPTLKVANRVCVELGIFDALSKLGTANAAELAKEVHTDEELVRRLLKHLGVMGVIEETGTDTYRSTRLSRALTEVDVRDSVIVGFDILTPGVTGLHKYLASNNHRVPQDPMNTAFQVGLDTKLHFFQYLEEVPSRLTQFANYMAGYSLSRSRWMEPGCVPVGDVLREPTGGDGVLLVDVGGGKGHDLALFQRLHPNLSGRLVLQDLPSVVNACKAELSEGIEAMGHDFFTPQPIKGASAYYLHSILHDWPDDKCKQILENLAEAMTPGFSKILINENVVLNTGNHWETTGLDLCMMSLMSAEERSEAHWHKLLDSAGLRITEIWTYEKGTESIIEAELA